MSLARFFEVKKNKAFKKKTTKLKYVKFNVQPIYWIEVEKSFYLRGDLVIDIDFIRSHRITGDGCGQYGFNTPVSVEFKKDKRIFEIESHRLNAPMMEFSSVITILDNAGDSECHEVAMYLRQYQEFFEKFDEKKESVDGILFGETPLHSYYKQPSIEFDYKWNFNESCRKAYLIVEERNAFEDSTQINIYQIVKGDGSIEKYVISEKATNFLLGKSSISEQSKLFLSQLELVQFEDIYQTIAKKQFLYEFFLRSLLSPEKNQPFRSSNIGKFKMVNNEIIVYGIKIDRIPLSNYSSPKPNDFLIIFQLLTEPISPPSIDCTSIQGSSTTDLQLQLVKSDDVLKSDIPYTMMSEHFIEKYYGQLGQASNKVVLKRQSSLKKKQILKEQFEQAKRAKKCGFISIKSTGVDAEDIVEEEGIQEDDEIIIHEEVVDEEEEYQNKNEFE